MPKIRWILLALPLVFVLGGTALSGCDDQGPVEEAGEAVDDAGEDTGDAVEDTFDD
ncbi:hypothetical protein [Aquisalimonas sp.]|uniref:hypothetical protein n=1 Tax=Aquisalimonas sp. TaxID=1872621 RepID=UPI0025C4253C|nr:hypothetical protein [Aquisalimonas sp.]